MSVVKRVKRRTMEVARQNRLTQRKQVADTVRKLRSQRPYAKGLRLNSGIRDRLKPN